MHVCVVDDDGQSREHVNLPCGPGRVLECGSTLRVENFTTRSADGRIVITLRVMSGASCDLLIFQSRRAGRRQPPDGCCGHDESFDAIKTQAPSGALRHPARLVLDQSIASAVAPPGQARWRVHADSPPGQPGGRYEADASPARQDSVLRMTSHGFLFYHLTHGL